MAGTVSARDRAPSSEMNASNGVVPDWLRYRAATVPQRTALVAGGVSLTFHQLDQAVTAVTQRLAALGVRPDDRVALLLGNGIPFASLVHAAARMGFAIVPLNTRLTTAELTYQLNDSNVRFLVCDEGNRGTAEGLAGSQQDLSLVAVEHLLDVDEGRASAPSSDSTVASAVGLSLHTTHTIAYTSGTTGRPKGVPLTLGNHWWNAIGSALHLGFSPEDRLLVCLPLYHVGGLSMLFRGMIYGVTVVIHESFDAAAVNRAIDEEHVTAVSVVAVMLQRIVGQRGNRPSPSSLRTVLVGGGPVPEALLRDAMALGLPVLQTYGLTESASQAVTLAPEDALRKIGSAGRPLFPVDLRVAVGNRDAATGEVGEIFLRGPSIMAAYLGESPFAGGWLPTGDLGWLDEEGYLYVSDRRDDLIISGGENVYPAEVEAALLAHPSVEEAGVIGVPHAEWGQVPSAFVKLRLGAATTEQELIEFCAERLGRYKVPRRVYFRESLPRTTSGKLMRHLLRDESGRTAP